MMFLNESLYGWGVCNIPMPRSSYDIFSDRRKKNGRVSIFSKHRQSELPGILTSISGLFAHDVPWFQTVTVCVFGLLSIVFILLISKMLPEFVQKEMPEPIEIIIQTIKEPPKKIKAPVPDVPKPIIEKKVIEEITPPKSVVKVRPEREKPQYVVKKEPLPEVKPKPVPEETIPAIRIQPRIKKKAPEQKKMYVPQITSLEKMAQPEDLNVSVPADRKERYNNKERPPKENEPEPSDRLTDFVSKDPVDPSIAVTAQVAQKNYRAEVERRDVMVPSEGSEPLLMTTRAPDEPISSAKPTQREYKDQERKQSMTVLTDTSGPILTVLDNPDPTISPVERTQKNYTATDEARDVKLPLDETGSLLPQPDVSATEVDTINRSQKNYEADMLDSQKPKTAESKFISFDHIIISEIDPSQLISLRELAVCADPEQEFRLRTKLAVLLQEPTRCESKGVLLFFKYPESGYTIRVEIYNPGGVVLEDRCSVLQLAVECINDQKAKGVVP